MSKPKQAPQLSTTPETDAAELIYDGIVASGYVDSNVCRKLERERDKALTELRLYAERLTEVELSGVDERARLERERDEAREALVELRRWVGDGDCSDDQGIWPYCATQAYQAAVRKADNALAAKEAAK